MEKNNNTIAKFDDFEDNSNVNTEEKNDKNNYMFFQNIDNMKRIIEEIENMNHDEVDDILMDHDWASDHISVAGENLDQVFHFLSKKIKK